MGSERSAPSSIDGLAKNAKGKKDKMSVDSKGGKSDKIEGKREMSMDSIDDGGDSSSDDGNDAHFGVSRLFFDFV